MVAALLVVLALAAAWVLVPRYLDDVYYVGARSDHFDGERFFNPGMAPRKPGGLLTILKWRLDGSNRAEWPASVPVTPARPAPRVEGDEMVVTAVGHASVLVQTHGLNILTDPVWSERASPFASMGPKRVRAPGVALEDLPKIDVVLVSHNHYDHLDLDTLEKLWKRDQPIIVTPLGNAALMARRGIIAFARDWGQTVGITEKVGVTIERVQHWSARWSSDRNRALWGGFTVTTPAGNIYFAGDCGYEPGSFKAAGQRGPVRLALLPIGAYLPRDIMKVSHMNPAEAVQAFNDLGAAQAVGIHFGTFQLTDEAIDAPTRDLDVALGTAGIAPERFRALLPGQSMAVPPLAVPAR